MVENRLLKENGVPYLTNDGRASSRPNLWGRIKHRLGLAKPDLFGFVAGNGSHGSPFARSHEETVEDHVRKLTSQGRSALVLHRELAEEISDFQAVAAWKRLDEEMALIPGGVLPIIGQDGSSRFTEVPAFFIDRCSVTNQQYAEFVRAGCYEDLEIWPQDIWPALATRFLDSTRCAGPADWENGRYPSGKAQHPVVGISWYEASAYAQWVGKRLLTAAEWQKAGGFPEQISGGASISRYPWGELFAEGRANLYQAGIGATVPVRDFKSGATRNGIYQMSGNVWEWLEDRLETIVCQPDERLVFKHPMRRIMGGSYNTYLISEAANFFVTGQSELDRRPNIGFRCAVPLDRLRQHS